MKRKTEKGVRVAEALLPLLDVAILLLGFYIILFAIGEFSPPQVVTERSEKSLPGLDRVLVLRIENENSLLLYSSTDVEPVRIPGLNQLEKLLTEIYGEYVSEHPTLLVYHRAWSLPDNFVNELNDTIRKIGYRHFHFYGLAP